MRVPTRKGELTRRLKHKEDNYLTKAKIQRLERELKDLQKRQRPEATAEVRRTGEMGDFSENAAYQMAKGVLRRINTRILSLTERIKSAIVIEEGSVDGVLAIGSRVRLEKNGKEFMFEIVGAQETDPTRGRISYLSPLGKALMSKKAGDEAIGYRILEVN